MRCQTHMTTYFFFGGGAFHCFCPQGAENPGYATALTHLNHKASGMWLWHNIQAQLWIITWWLSDGRGITSAFGAHGSHKLFSEFFVYNTSHQCAAIYPRYASHVLISPSIRQTLSLKYTANFRQTSVSKETCEDNCRLDILPTFDQQCQSTDGKLLLKNTSFIGKYSK